MAKTSDFRVLKRSTFDKMSVGGLREPAEIRQGEEWSNRAGEEVK